MRKLLLFPLAILLVGCGRAAENVVTLPPTDHAVSIAEDEIPSEKETEAYVTYETDTLNLSAEPDTPLKLLLEGTFHKSEVWQHAEKRNWLSVSYEGGRYILRPAQINVNTVYDPVFDSDKAVNGKKMISGREVVSLDSSTVFLITGLSNFTAGQLDTAAFDKSILPANKSLTYTFKGKRYQISAYGDSTQQHNAEYRYQNYGWKVSGVKKGKKIEQLLAEDKYFDDSIYMLLWAGDLDRDGIPDLLLDVSNHYNVSKIALFLSSKAEKGKLYKKVAVFETIGC